MRRLRFLCLVGLALVLLPACQVDVEVGLDVDRDGGGEVIVAVTLDDDAARHVGELEKELRVDDLRDAGWDVRPDDDPEQGGARVTAIRSFKTPAQAEEILRQVAGEDGPLRGIRIDQDRSLFRRTTRFEATADLTGGLESFSDADLTERLGGVPLGVSIEEIEQQYGIDVDDSFSFIVRADLAGSVDSNAPGEQPASWTPELGERLEMRATGRAWNTKRIAWLALAVASALALVAFVVSRAARRRLVSWS